MKPRRRSLKSLLQLPPTFFAKTPPADGTVTNTPGGAYPTTKAIPLDIIITIAELLCPVDVLSFSLTSSTLRHLLLPTLYASVILKSSQKCYRTLLMLSTRRDVCGYIRKLVVRPNYYLSWPRRDSHLDEDWVADMIERIAPSLVLLNTFDWDGLEVPGDSLWEALKKSCPLLRNISTNLGTRLVHSGCKLFQFSNLTTFSIVVRHNLGGDVTAAAAAAADTFPPAQRLPDAFWEMILHQCPELSELTICSFSPYTYSFDITPLLVETGHDVVDVDDDSGAHPCLPRLTSLTLGSFGYQSDFSLGVPSEPSFGRFIAAHPSLTTLRLLWTFRRWVSPDVVPLSTSLPKLTTFVGIYQQLAEIPEEHRVGIEVVDLTCEPVYEGRVGRVADVLRTMRGLRCLEVWVHVGGAEEGGGSREDNNFGKLVGACSTGLEELHVVCTTAFTRKRLEHLLSALDRLPALCRFSLTKGHRYLGDESMMSTAMRVVRRCRGVRTVSVRLAREGCANHLKREGVYEVVREGDEVVVLVNERGISIVGRVWDRKRVYNYKDTRPY